jgi:tRNA (guanine-N7-)-methyltransferase
MDYFLKTFSLQKEREGRVRQFFSNQITPLINSTNKHSIDLEIGCGHGHWINEYAQRNKTKICIGIDLISKRIEKATVKKENAKNTNLCFLKAEAIEFINYKPKELVFTNVFVFFPDPWPKKKHHKRRLIQDSFLNLLHINTHEHSKIFFRTDHLEYFDWVRLKIKENAYWKLSDAVFPFSHDSYFQQLLPNFSSIVAAKA